MSDMETELTARLKTTFDNILLSNFGNTIAPPPIVTPFGIRHLDALLGNGLCSSSPIILSSTPETGKSTIAFQFASVFQKTHKNSVIVYLDIEGSSNIENSKYFENRMKTFDLDTTRVSYIPSIMTLNQVFEFIDKTVKVKYDFENAIKSKSKELSDFEVKVLIIWDSIAATPSSKEITSDDPNEIIGYKARELTYFINKYKQTIMMNRISFLIIDQIRSNIKIQSKFAPQDEKSVGTFNNYKSATNVSSFQHAVKQWMYLSKLTTLYANDGFGVDGHVISVRMEKNKLAPSGGEVPIVFDKKYGVIPLYSEYLFMSEMTRTEKKMTGNKAEKLVYPLAINAEERSKVITIINPSTGQVIEKSDKFTEKKLKEKYETEPEFRRIFDSALDISIQERIHKGLFRFIENSHSLDAPPEL
ncbi:MAG: hypothetical protein IPH62_19525 [Ignavibacteriae bacterium]|nr:hypothetical protein [Ignavibacteriota bacterium]